MSNSGKPAPAPPEILKSIEAGSARVKELATDLSKRIELFEEWLNRLPGRIETAMWLDGEDEQSSSFGLRLHRSGKRWILSTCFYHEEWDDGGGPVWEPLTSKSLEIKLKAIQLFPLFLHKIAVAQEQLAKEIEAAQAEFDEFALEIGAYGKEGA